jgi:hypothetical protein
MIPDEYIPRILLTLDLDKVYSGFIRERGSIPCLSRGS